MWQELIATRIVPISVNEIRPQSHDHA